MNTGFSYEPAQTFLFFSFVQIVDSHSSNKTANSVVNGSEGWRSFTSTLTKTSLSR